MRMQGARRFQAGGMNNPVLAAANMPARPATPGGVNPQPALTPGGTMGSPFQAGAPAAGLGAAAPGLSPAAIQAAVQQRRMQAGMSMPGGGMPGGGMPQGMPGGGGMPQGMPAGGIPGGGPTQTNPLAQQLQARGAVPTVVPGGGLQGMPGGGMAPPAAGTNPVTAAQAWLGPGTSLPAGFGQGTPMMPQGAMNLGAAGPAALAGPPGMAKGGRVRKFNSLATPAENLPVKSDKKAKGGVLRRRPPKPPVAAKAKAPKLPPPPPPGQQGPPDTDNEPDFGSDMNVPPTGMAKGGKWIQKAIKKPGALHKQLGIAEDKKIPEKKLAKAAKAPGKLGERARLAEKLKGFKKAKGGKCDKMAAGGAAKQRKGFPNTTPPPRRFAEGGRVRGCGIATKGCNFSGIY